MSGAMLRLANLALLILFPVAWFAPLLRAGLLPLFGLSEISVITGLQSLWETDVAAGAAGHLPCDLRALRQDASASRCCNSTSLSPRLLPALHCLGRLAMADIFLIALYIVRGQGRRAWRTVETAWGLYLFTGCILALVMRIWIGPPLTAPTRPRLHAKIPGNAALHAAPCRPASGAEGMPGMGHMARPPSLHLHRLRRRPSQMGRPLRRLRRLEHHRRGGPARPPGPKSLGAKRPHASPLADLATEEPPPPARLIGHRRARPRARRRPGAGLGHPGRRRSRHRQVDAAAAGRRQLRPRGAAVPLHLGRGGGGAGADARAAARPRRCRRSAWAPRPTCATS